MASVPEDVPITAIGDGVNYSVLGPLEVRDEGVIDLGSRKQRAVLALLLKDAGRVVSVDGLIEGLWGDSPPASAVGTLQAYVSNLRKILEPGRSPDQAPTVLKSQAPGYVLHVDDDKIDVRRFEVAVRAGRAALESGSFEEAASLLRGALDLWKGSPYADFAFEPFAIEEIDRLEELRLAAIEDRVDADLMLGRHRALIGELKQLIEANPLRERLRAQLGLALYRDARQADALAVLKEGRERLVEELGIDPGPELRLLEEQILRQDASLEWVTPQAESTERDRSSALVGRDRELVALARAAEGARSGAGRAVLFAGEPGIGKSTLVETFCASVDGMDVYWGRCFDGTGAPPLWPWRQILKGIAESRGRSKTIAAAGEDLPILAQAMPEWADDARSGAESVVDPEEARFRQHAAITSFLLRLALDKPMVLALDDLHWADVASLRLLQFFVTELSGAAIVLVGTFRDGEVDREHPFSSTLASLARTPAVERVGLAGLSGPDVATLVEQGGWTDAPRDAIEVLTSRTGGNPFYVRELVRLHGKGAGDDLAPVPDNVRDVILQRISSLPPETANFLDAASVLGRHFELPVVAEICSLEPSVALEHLSPAVQARIVGSDDGSGVAFLFSHALVGDAVYEDMAPATRVQWHLRAAEVLERRHGGSPDWHAEIGAHFIDAASLGTGMRGADYLLRAAEYAMGQFAYEDAARGYELAIKVLASEPEGPERDRLELVAQAGLGNVLMTTRGYAAPSVEPVIARAGELSRKLGDERQLVSSLWPLLVMHCAQSKIRKAVEDSEEIDRVVRGTDDPSMEWVAATARGIAAWQQGRAVDAQEALERASVLVDSVDRDFIEQLIPERDPGILCRGFLANALWFRGERDLGRRMAEEQVQLARDLGHRFATAFALLRALSVATLDHDLDLVERHCVDLIELSRSSGFPVYGEQAAMFRGWVRAMRGAVDAGVADMDAALDRIHGTGDHSRPTRVLVLRAEAHLVGRRIDDVLADVADGLEQANSLGQSQYDAELHRLRGEALAAAGRTDEAEVAFQEALVIAVAQGATSFEEQARDALQALGARIMARPSRGQGSS